MTSTIRKSVVYPHGRDKVWAALTDPEALARWLMPNDFQPRVGHRFTMQADPGPGFDGKVERELLELEPSRRMVWSWRGGPIDTTVAFELSDEPAGTRLTVIHSGFAGTSGRLIRVALSLGWARLLRRKLAQELATS